MASFFSRNFSIPFLSYLDNIPKTPTRISIMILGVMILTIYFSLEFLFVGELVILEKCDEFLHYEEIKDFIIRNRTLGHCHQSSPNHTTP